MIIVHLRSIRKTQELSIRKLAEISYVSKSDISAIERGQRIPSLETLNRLAYALKINVNALYTWKKDI